MIICCVVTSKHYLIAWIGGDNPGHLSDVSDPLRRKRIAEAIETACGMGGIEDTEEKGSRIPRPGASATDGEDSRGRGVKSKRAEVRSAEVQKSKKGADGSRVQVKEKQDSRVQGFKGKQQQRPREG